MTDSEPSIISMLRRAGDLTIIMGGLHVSCIMFDEPFTNHYFVLMILAGALWSIMYFQIAASPGPQNGRLSASVRGLIWGSTIAVLILIGLIKTNSLPIILNGRMLLAWAVATPVATFAWRRAISYFATRVDLRPERRSAIIIGVSEITLKVVRAFSEEHYFDLHVHGYFDDRDHRRLPWSLSHPVLGSLDDISRYVIENSIKIVVIGAPISGHPRLAKLSSELQDTTASIYCVPDVSLFQLTRPRLAQVGGVPVIAVCETPFTGINSAIKRWMDIVLSSLILLLAFPFMASIALAIALTSRGPIIFRQGRYGLHGETIVVYKFRSMTVAEDGPVVVQARQNDQRLTPVGAFLRKTSLDELPQFVNVLQGRMSIVGPRPHAIAHNEHYRKLIRGYMLRHKVKPGITGLAQVNGFRGETSTIDKMEARVSYDLDYLRNWSPWLDLWIIAKTIVVVFRRENAY